VIAFSMSRTSTQSRERLAIVEKATLIGSGPPQDGVLILSHASDCFEFHWSHIKGSVAQHLATVIQSKDFSPPKQASANTTQNHGCTDFAKIRLGSDGDDLRFVFIFAREAPRSSFSSRRRCSAPSPTSSRS
jgi:hypothetical protein